MARKPSLGLDENNETRFREEAMRGGASMGGWFLSRRDSTIVARNEVPGIMRKIGFVQ
jgi:hypothetical protein